VVKRFLPALPANHPRYRKDESTLDWQFRREMFGPPVGTEEEWISAYRALPASAFLQPDLTRPPHLTQGLRFVSRALDDAWYIQMNQVDSAALGPLLEAALKEIDQVRPRRLIIDIRYNFGGDGSTVSSAVGAFMARKTNPPWRELYLLTGRRTFSAGVMLLDAFVDFTEATLVGEPAGAHLNHFGDPTERRFPLTGLRLNVSTLRHQLGKSNDVGELVPVDVPAVFSFSDYVSGRDPAVDPILGGAEMRAIPSIALAEGGAAARRVWQDRKNRFAAFRGWAPATEFELRTVCDALVEQKRVDDALETCRLSTEIHPWVWNSWYNLGRTQRAAGQMHERLLSFRRVLEVDPNNFNAAAIRRATAEALQPAVVRYGATVAEMEKALAGSCSSLKARRIDPPFLENVRTVQMQIDCDGFSYLGKPRWAEFVFRDDSLEMVWIMTSTAEEPDILSLMKVAYGEPARRNDKYIAFPDGRTAIRFKPAEVLLYSPNLDSYTRPWFE
jgi:hypothetical protein